MSTQSTGNPLHAFTSAVLPKGFPPGLITAVEDATLDVFQRHGVSAFAAPQKAAVVHEVGHAIVGTHEGFKIQEISICSRTVPIVGLVWGGRCEEKAETWTSGPDTSSEDDLRRARFAIAGIAGEAIYRLDKPGSSLDETVLSQMLGHNAAVKLGHILSLSDAEYNAYAEHFWNEQVWDVTIAILRNNREPFMQVAELLDKRKRVKGGKLHKILDQVKRVADPVASEGSIDPCQ